MAEITREDYDRQFDRIIEAFRTGALTVREASDAMRELTGRRVRETRPPRR